MTVKEQVLKVVQELPRDASIEEAMERLYFLCKVEQGIKQADAGQKVSLKEKQKHYGSKRKVEKLERQLSNDVNMYQIKT